MRFFSKFFLVTAAFIGTTSMASSGKVGTVDIQRAIEATKRGKTGLETFKKEADAKEKVIEVERNKLQAQGQEFEKKAAVLSEKARQEKIVELQRKGGELQQLIMKTQSDLQNRQQELTRPLVEGLRALVPELAKSKGVDMVFESNTAGPGVVAPATLLYAANQIDLTEDLIKLFDQKNK